MAVQWVVKASKLCNLRCRYCYEYVHLGDSRRLDAQQLDAFFRHVAEFYAGSDLEQDFVWHGGEPLLLGSEYFATAFELQERYLGAAGVKWSNSIQTNLTKLNDEKIALLKRFDNVGVSVDVFGGFRVTATDHDAQPGVLENMQRLFAEDINFGCISVLSTANVGFVREMHRFFSQLALSYRLLPIYRTGFDGQHDRLGIAPEAILAAYKTVFDLWREDPVEIQIRPIVDFVTAVVRRMLGQDLCRNWYIRKPSESLFLLDTDGTLHSNADAYSSEACYGNIINQSLDELLQGSSYLRALESRMQRSNSACKDCHWHGACSGFFVAEATPEQRWLSAEGALSCPVVRPMLDYIWNAFEKDDSVLDAVQARIAKAPGLSGAFQY